MATIENGWITMEQYKAAYNSRVHENRVQSTELYVVSFRIQRHDMGTSCLARVHHREQNPLVGLALDLTLLNDDMQDIYTAMGVMTDGVWNTKPPLYVGTASEQTQYVCLDGVLAKDEGLEIPGDWLEEAADLSRPRILETTSH